MAPFWGRLQAALRATTAAGFTTAAKAKRWAAAVTSLRSRRTGGAGSSAGSS
jgi:hypothetical protein